MLNTPPYTMVQLKRLNGENFTLNALMIEQIQSHPDTTITLTNGKKIVVLTSEEEVITRTTNFFQSIGLYGTLKEAGDSDE
ncbi:flagellar FlbD family protein [Virgibacillus sp. W0430]|uniref:flagellar FlbD family protein n=1 Tax=Virgibacillus sp. W0430 TaxID=3391580 RepID=UPI003F44F720